VEGVVGNHDPYSDCLSVMREPSLARATKCRPPDQSG
jgi:hypothetical protein